MKLGWVLAIASMGLVQVQVWSNRHDAVRVDLFVALLERETKNR